MLKNLFKSTLLKGSSIYIITNVLNASTQFLLMPLLTTYLTPEEYGTLSMYTVLLGFIVPFVGLNISSSIARNYYDKETINFPNYVFNGFFILLMTFLTTTFIVFMSKDWLYSLTKFPSNWLWIITLIAALQMVYQIALVYFQVRSKPLNYGIFQILQTLFNLLFTFIFVAKLGLNWQGRIDAILFSYAIFSVISIFIIYKGKWFKKGLNKNYLKESISFGVPLIPHSIGAYIITMTDRIFITNMFGLSETGVYTLGVQIGMVIGLIQDSFNKAWVPWFYNNLNKKKKTSIVKITYLYYAILILLFIGFTIVAPIGIRMFIDDRYQDAGNYIFWISLGYVFNGMYKMLVNYIFYMKKTAFLALLTFLTSILNIMFTYILIKFNGAIGAAQATSISFFISFILTWIYAQRVYPMPWKIWKRSEVS